MESIEMIANEVEKEKETVDKIPAEISGLLDVVKLLTDKVDSLVAAYAVKTEADQAEDEVEVVEDDTTEEVEE